nr:hypothetical protein [Falsiruegeria mediterranea]
MDKKSLSEQDIRSKFITPALQGSGWDLQTQIEEERHLTARRIIVRGKMVARGNNKRADYVLFAKPNIPIAIVEAKDNNHVVGGCTQQAITYAKMLRVTTAGTTRTRLINALLHEALTPAAPIPEAAE